ncbi:MAG: PAS domain-containing protein [Isosphaeraceae bacterium]
MSHGEPPSAAPDGRSRTPTPDPEQGLTGQLLAELEDLRLRLEEAEETIRAIREGEVDAFVVAGPVSERVFTLESTEHPYRRLVEAMHQAALTVTCEGAVLYVNRAFVRTVNIPRETILGRQIHDFFVPASRPTVDEILARGTGGRGEVLLIRGDGHMPLPCG